MAKKKNSNLSYDQYVSKYGDKKAGTISYDQYMAKQAEREQQAQQQAREQRQNYINKLAAKATIQKARDMNNPIMNNTGMGQAENARNSFGIGTDKADKRGYVEWLRKLDKTKKDKEAGVQPQQKVTPIVQRSPEEIKTEFMTQKRWRTEPWALKRWKITGRRTTPATTGHWASSLRLTEKGSSIKKREGTATAACRGT